jgi:hypothetical protein
MMNARNFVTAGLAFIVLAAGVAQARQPIGTAKARGDYSGYSATRSQRGMAGSRSTYRYRAPTRRTAPMIVAAPVTPAPAAVVAQAPVESRRFSYAPAPAVEAAAPATTSPCVPSAAAPSAARRYSYAPATGTSVSRVPRAYYGGSRYSRGGGGRSHATDLWALPKTDPRKYNSR